MKLQADISEANRQRRVAAFKVWIGAGAGAALEQIRNWPTGGLLPNETLDDLTHNILDRIRERPAQFLTTIRTP